LIEAKIKGTSTDASSQPTFRTPLVLFAILDLALLGTRLWPWQNVLSLPDAGATGIDPAVCLVAYIGLALLIGRIHPPVSRKYLFSSGLLGLLGGLLLAGYVLIANQGAGQPDMGDVIHSQFMRIGLLAAAAAVWGIAALRPSRGQESIGFSMICAAWSALVSCTMAFAAVMAQDYLVAAPTESADPWKQYEGLAIGSAATQSLIQSLVTATGFLLIGPLVALIAGAFFSYFGRSHKA
jgi:hypothetical protein